MHSGTDRGRADLSGIDNADHGESNPMAGGDDYTGNSVWNIPHESDTGHLCRIVGTDIWLCGTPIWISDSGDVAAYGSKLIQLWNAISVAGRGGRKYSMAGGALCGRTGDDHSSTPDVS